MSRNWHALDLSPIGPSWDNMRMEQMIDRLRKIVICQETIEAIQNADDENEAKECALLLIAMYDDRHEFVA